MIDRLARVTESVDVAGLKPAVERRAGSSPAPGTSAANVFAGAPSPLGRGGMADEWLTSYGHGLALRLAFWQ